MKQFQPRTIRTKLLLWFLTTITLTYLMLGILVGGVIWRVLHDQIDHHLHTVIAEAEQVVATFPSTERNNLLELFAMQRGMTVTILANDGFPVLQTNSPDVAKLSLQVLQHLLNETPLDTTIPVHFNVNDFRFATIPVALPEGQGLLAIGYSLGVVEQTFRQILIITGLMLLTALGLTTYGIRILLTRYLEPVETIATDANMITSSKDLSHRLSVKIETVELKALTDSINRMLDRLEAFFQNEHQFFSDAAHTLKTPLAITKAFLESLRDTKEKQVVIQEIDRASETIQDLILISRMNSDENVSYTKLSLSNLVEELGEITTVLAQDKKLTVTTSIQPNIVITANLALLRKALSNVIFNAINYTPAYGTIRIILLQKDNQILISITDTGIGIPAKDRSRIFNRFYRGSNVSHIKGTGLGLAMVKAIIEAHKGTLAIDSRLGHGTTVTIILSY